MGQRNLTETESRADVTTTVELPSTLVSRVDERLGRSEFSTTDEYVAYVLRAVLSRVEDASDETVESVERDEIETRLKSLGYLD